MGRGFAAFVMATLLACAARAQGNCPAHETRMARTELLSGAGAVSDAQWHDFLRREVTPRFPDGLTALEGYGQRRDPQGNASAERTRMLLIWHARGAAASAGIDAIRDAYKKQFHQQSVMRVDGSDCVSF